VYLVGEALSRAKTTVKIQSISTQSKDLSHERTRSKQEVCRQKRGAIANETLQKGKAAVDQSVQAFEQSYSAMVETMRDII
jgi:hypothetical protein